MACEQFLVAEAFHVVAVVCLLIVAWSWRRYALELEAHIDRQVPEQLAALRVFGDARQTRGRHVAASRRHRLYLRSRMFSAFCVRQLTQSIDKMIFDVWVKV